MEYIIITDRLKPNYNVARMYMGDYMARDFLSPLHRNYDGRISPTSPLTFETRDEAQKYLERNMNWILVKCKIVEYNACMNCISKKQLVKAN